MNEEGLSIKKNMLWNTAGSVIYLGLQWLITVLVVRISSSYEAAGQLALAMAFANLFTPIALYKIRAYQVSDVDNDFSSREYVGFRIVTIAVSFVITIVYALITTDLSVLPTIIFFVLFKAVDVFIDVLHGVDQRHEHMDYVGQSLLIRGVLSFIGFCAVLYFTDDLALAVLAMLVVTIPVAIFFDWPKARRFDELKPIITVRVTRDLGKRCLPAVLAAFCCSALVTFPRQYLAFLFGDAALGIYSSVANPVLIVQMGASYIYGPLLVPFSKLFSERNIKAFKSMLLKVTLAIFALGVVCSILFLLFGQSLLVLFYGDSIIGYDYLLIPILIATLLTAYIWLMGDLLILVRSMVRNLVGSALALVASIPLMIWLVQVFDMNGVSFTIIGASAIGILYLTYGLMKALREREERP